MAQPYLYTFGSQMGIPDPAYLSRIRCFLLQDPQFAPLVESVLRLPSFWTNVEKSCSTLEHVPGTLILEILRRWLQDDDLPQFTKPTPNTLLSPLTFICQVVEYLTYLHQVEKQSQSNVVGAVKRPGFQGLCIGLLSATIASSSKDEVELVAQASIAVRVAVLIGATVDADGNFAFPPRQMSSLAVRCSEVCDQSTIDRILDPYPQAYISVVSDSSTYTITALDSDLNGIQADLSSHRIVSKVLEIHGRYHTSVHEKSADTLATLCEKHETLRASKGFKMDLRQVLQEILCLTSNWNLTLLQTLHSVRNGTGYIVSVGPVNVITDSMVKAHQIKIVHTHKILNIESSAETAFKYPEHAVAIVGIGCRFSGASSPEEFWQLLINGQSMATKVPVQRFSPDALDRGQANLGKHYWGNFIANVDDFDHKFFGKSSREAATMDPQQRLLLEVTYQAVESAGWLGQARLNHPKEDVGCFVGCGSSDYNDNIACHTPGAFSILGSLRGLLSGRISHHFGWEAPSVTYDTACASSMVAIHAACTALQLGECSAAVAGGVNVLTSPAYFQNLDAAGFLSRSGASTAFDARASGYCRGDGAGMVVLKRLRDALAHGDAIQGVIAATSVNQNRNETSINVPSMKSQVKLFQKVLDHAHLKGEQVTFVEAHGTGTQVGDCIEAKSIRQVFGTGYRHDTLHLGSVKDNIGHTEGAAGVASLIKALLMIRHSTIAPQAGFQTLNAKIPPFEENNIQIPQKPLEWKTAFKAACVNNYGAGGCNAALVVCQPLATPSRPHQRLGKYPIFVSAKTEVSLKAYCRKLLRWLDAPLSLHGNDKLLAHLAYNLSQKQNRDLTYSIASDVADIGELGNFLRTYLDNPQAAQSLNLSSASASRPRPLVLLFGGQTGTDFKLSPSVLKSCRLIRTHLVDCDTALKRLGYEGIFPAIHSSEDHDLVTSHSILFSIQYASAKCWIDSGLKIDALLGHSFGHYTALCISGVLTLEHALKLVAGRAKLIKSAWGPEKGTMIALETDTDKLAWLLETMNQKFPNNGIEVACYNSSSSYVLVGTAASIKAVEKILHTRSSSTPVIKSKRLDIPYGFHSRLTDPVLPALTALAESLTYSTPRIPVASCLGEGSFPSQENAKGIVMHTRSPVQFARATEKLSSKLGQCTWLEAGTGSLITGMVRRAIGGSADSEHIFQPINLEESLNSLAHATIILWKHGHGHSFWPFHSSQCEEYEDLHLPPYSFETTPHWLPYTSTSNSTYTSAVEKKSAHYCKFERFANPDCKEAIFKVASDDIAFKSMVEGHAVLGNPLCPASVYVDIAVQAAKNLASRGDTPELSEMRFDLCHLNIEAPLGIGSSTTINASLTHNDTEPSRWAFELTSTDQVNDVIRHATGDIILHCRADVQTSDLFSSYSRLLDIGLCRNILNDLRAHSVSGPVIYTLFDKVVTYKPFYQGLRRIASLDREVAAQVMLPSERVVTNDHSTFAPVAVDCFLQVAGVQVNFLQETLRDEVYIASKLERILSEDEFPFSKAGREWTVYSKCSTPNDHSVVNDIFVFDSQTEKLVMVLCGVQFSRVPIRSLTKMLARASGVQLDAKMMPSALVREQMPIINEVASKSHVRNGSSASPNDLNKVLSNLLEVPEETLHPWDTFDDLGIDSLMITELANVVLHSFGVTLSTSELQSLGNIQSLASRLSMRTNTKISPVDTHEDSNSSTESYQESNDGVLFASTSQSSAEISLVDTYSAYDAHAVFKDASLQFDTFAKANNFDGYWQDVYPIHSRLIVAYLTEALSALGCPLATQEAGSHIPWPDHHPRHKKLVARLFEILEHMKLIRKVGKNEFVRTAVVVESTSPQELHETIEKLYPAYAQEHRLLQITGARFADCLSGTTDAVDLLFGTKMNKSLLEDVYSNAPIFKTATGFLAQYLAVALPTCYPGECVEILEIGAGTGGTTRELVDVLLRAGVNFKYTFTDISTSMVFKAKQKFKDLSNMQFQVLNIEDQSPVALHRRFHAVLSTNCIHATSNLVDSCRNIRSMLKPGGFTALIELTRKMPWYDLVFGLLEGWWAFSDDRTHALVDENVWSEKLQMAGFESVAWSSGMSEESCDIRVICGFNSASSDKTPASLGYQASSVLLQGHLDQAEETVFAFPGGFGTASTYTTLPALHNSIAVIGLNSPFLHSPSAFTVTLPELTSLYVSEIQRYQPSGPYTLMGYSVGGVMAYEATYQLISKGEQVKKLILLDSASPARFPPFPVGLLDFFDNIDRFSGTRQSESPSTSPVKGTSANKTKKMGDPHVVATLECLRTYDSQPLPEGCSPQTLVVAARYGVDRTKSITRPAVCETEQIVMEWVLDDRKDFGPRGFGWDRIIPSDMIEVVSVDGNHFSLMTEPSISAVSEELRKFLSVKVTDAPPTNSEEYAKELDRSDPLNSLRLEFQIPQKDDSKEPVSYLAGSAIGLQPKCVLTRIRSFVDQWAKQGLLAGFTPGTGENCPSWIEAENVAAKLLEPIVGAIESEVTLMNSLTTNLHLLLASFYQPNKEGNMRTRIIVEEAAFSSDWYALHSQIAWHGLDPMTELVSIPADQSGILSMEVIYSTIDANANSSAVLILSGVQYHTGQLLDIHRITAYAQERGIVVGWDLAHAVGNVTLKLHEWNVDFAVWCSYKYLNAGPGATAGVFLHERHGKDENRPRLAGWWGMPVSQRFSRQDCFTPSHGAAGFKLSSPSILDITAVTAALSVINSTTMERITDKSQQLTGYLESLLQQTVATSLNGSKGPVPWTLVTPCNPAQRGAMLCLRWHDFERLDRVVKYLRDHDVVLDVRWPDVMRITPVAIYNTFEDVWNVVRVLKAALLHTENGEVEG